LFQASFFPPKRESIEMAMNSFRNEMIYGIDFANFGVHGNSNAAPDYSQPSHPHKTFPSSLPQPQQSQRQQNEVGSFHPPPGMEELYNLLINASEREFPVELNSSISQTQKLPEKTTNGLESREVPTSEPKGRSSRKRRYPQTPNQTNLTSSSIESSNDVGGRVQDGACSSPEEEHEETNEVQAKRTRRLVKNREAAQLFRQRQKAYIGDLEQKVDKLSTENVTLQSKVDLLSAENKLIKEQLGYLRNFISQVTMTLPGPFNQPIPRETAFSRNKVGFDPKY